MMVPVFSEKAVQALKDILEPNGELLPLKSAVGKFFAYNVTTVADVLDRDSSEVIWMSRDPGPWDVRAMDIEKYVFHGEQLDSLTIFQLPELAGRTFVTSKFVQRVKEKKLDGFDFIDIWSK